MAEITIKYNHTEFTLPYVPGMSIRDILEPTTMRIRSSCGGKGKCGLCLVKIESGQISPPTKKETEFLDYNLIQNGIRLACLAQPIGDDVIINKNTPVPKSIWKPLPEDEFLYENILLKPVKPNFSFPMQMQEIGISIDLGTTYLRCALWDLTKAEYISGFYALNPQASSGSDILTRLMIATESPENAMELSSLVRESISECLNDVITKYSLSSENIRRVMVVGNTAMLSLFCNHNYGQLLQPEYWSEEIQFKINEPEKLNSLWGLNHETAIHIIPSISGFVGSDLLVGIISTRLMDETPGSLLIDFGTNTEIALWDGNSVWVTSTPGGPAFEGSGISCGMPADQGAIYKVRHNGPEGNYFFDVIGGGNGRGICGTGLVDTLAVLLNTGRLTQGGQFTGNKDFFPLGDNGNLTLEKNDIDILQRAKAPVGAGIQCLLKHAGMKVGDLKRVCVSGTFGRLLDITSAIDIGLLPAIGPDKVELWGNSALGGCTILMFSENYDDIISFPKKRTKTINLAMDPDFDDLFIDCLYLRPMNIE